MSKRSYSPEFKLQVVVESLSDLTSFYIGHLGI